jgi:hypothetical protein
MVSRAQGVIEYLVIIAIIMVFSLVVVGFITQNPMGETTSISSETSTLRNSSSVISVTDVVSDIDGDGLVTIQNNSGERMDIVKISVGGTDINYGTSMPSGDKKIFSLNGISSDCSCTGAVGTKKTCDFTIYAKSDYGLIKAIDYSITVDCVSTALSMDDNKVVPACLDSCSALGYSCGNWTICGSLTSCGTCSAGYDCNVAGVCNLLPSKIMRLRPNAEGDINTWVPGIPGTPNWQLMRDANGVPSGVPIYTAGVASDLYNFDDANDTGVINSVTLYINESQTNSASIQLSLKDNNTITNASLFNFIFLFPSQWGTIYRYSNTWTARPSDGNLWTWADINALQAGIDSLAYIHSGAAYGWGVYIDVNYS